MRGKVLLIVHQLGSYPGRVGHLLMDMGYLLDIRCPCIGQELPPDPEEYALVAVFGGPMSANDCYLGGIRAELDWMPKVLDSKVPFLGICLGAQMLARFLGGRVALHDDGHVEIGYSPLEPTEHGQDYFEGPMQVYQWHKEGFAVPESCVLLAEGKAAFPNQAFRYGDRAYGLQFHPEVTREMMERWTTYGAHMLDMPGAMCRDEQFASHPIHDPPLDVWTRRFLEGLIAKSENVGGAREAA